MLTPQQNPIGYQNSTCLDIPLDINNSTSNLILIYGTADDNVHPLNTFHFISELQKRNILFESMFYPDQNHGIIRSGETTKQLHKSILEKLKLAPNEK